MGNVPTYHFQETIRVFNLGDVHRASAAHDARLFEDTVKEIAKDPNAHWVSTGDILDVALKDSKSDVYLAHPLGEEFQEVVSILQPIAGKCLGMVSSNHHERFNRAVGMSLDTMLAQSIGIPYLGEIGLVSIVVGGASYYMALAHGFGGGRKRGSKANNLEEFGHVVQGADVYMSGHTHTFMTWIQDSAYIDRHRHNQKLIPQTFVTTAHFLKWEGSYAQRALFKPAVLGAAVVTLHRATIGRISNSKRRVGVELFN